MKSESIGKGPDEPLLVKVDNTREGFLSENSIFHAKMTVSNVIEHVYHWHAFHMGGITHPTPKAAAAFDCVPNGSSVNWVPLWDVIQGRSGRGGYGPKRPFPTLTVGHFRS